MIPKPSFNGYEQKELMDSFGRYSWLSTGLYLEWTKTQKAGHSCDEFFLVTSFEAGRPTFNLESSSVTLFFWDKTSQSNPERTDKSIPPNRFALRSLCFCLVSLIVGELLYSPSIYVGSMLLFAW